MSGVLLLVVVDVVVAATLVGFVRLESRRGVLEAPLEPDDRFLLVDIDLRLQLRRKRRSKEVVHDLA